MDSKDRSPRTPEARASVSLKSRSSLRKVCPQACSYDEQYEGSERSEPAHRTLTYQSVCNDRLATESPVSFIGVAESRARTNSTPRCSQHCSQGNSQRRSIFGQSVGLGTAPETGNRPKQRTLAEQSSGKPGELEAEIPSTRDFIEECLPLNDPVVEFATPTGLVVDQSLAEKSTPKESTSEKSTPKDSTSKRQVADAPVTTEGQSKTPKNEPRVELTPKSSLSAKQQKAKHSVSDRSTQTDPIPDGPMPELLKPDKDQSKACTKHAKKELSPSTQAKRKGPASQTIQKVATLEDSPRNERIVERCTKNDPVSQRITSKSCIRERSMLSERKSGKLQAPKGTISKGSILGRPIPKGQLAELSMIGESLKAEFKGGDSMLGRRTSKDATIERPLSKLQERLAQKVSNPERALSIYRAPSEGATPEGSPSNQLKKASTEQALRLADSLHLSKKATQERTRLHSSRIDEAKEKIRSQRQTVGATASNKTPPSIAPGRLLESFQESKDSTESTFSTEPQADRHWHSGCRTGKSRYDERHVKIPDFIKDGGTPLMRCTNISRRRRRHKKSRKRKKRKSSKK